MENSAAQPSKFEKLWRWVPAILFLIAFLIRLVGINWGLPNELHNQSYHPDEQPIWSFSQGINPAEFDFVPGVYNYGTLYLTSLRVATDIVSTCSGKPDPTNPESVWQFISKCHLAGRIISTTAGAALAALVYLMALKITSRFGAVFAGAMIALSPGLVVHSRFQTTDILACALFAASLGGSIRLLSTNEGKERLRWVLITGILAGLSAGVKYTGILAILSLVAALWPTGSVRWKMIGIGTTAAITAFLITTPGALLDFEKFRTDFIYETIHTSTGHGLLFEAVGSGFLYHVGNLVLCIGTIGLALSAWGLFSAGRQRSLWALVLLPTFLAYFILIGRAEVLFLRYVFPLVVVLALAFGWLMGECHAKKGKHAALVIAGILGLGTLAVQTVMWTSAMTSVDPRDAAAKLLKEWAVKEPNATVGLVSDPWYYTPPLIKDSAILRGMISFQAEEMRASRAPAVFTSGMDDPQRYDWDARLFDKHPDYIVYSSFESSDLERISKFGTEKPEVKLQLKRFQEFQALLKRDYAQMTVPLNETGQRGRVVHDMQYVAPVIYIWKKKNP